jgi:hypothetical protein
LPGNTFEKEKNKMKHILLICFASLAFSACSSIFSTLNGKLMSQLELGMSKDDMIRLLGRNFTISEMRMEGVDRIEVFSYRNYPYTNEFYEFVFVNGLLNEWFMEITPNCEVVEN